MDREWASIVDILRKTVNPGLFQVWIKPLDASIQGDRLTLFAPNPFVATWVRDRLTTAILEAAGVALGRTMKLTVETRHNGDSRTGGRSVAAPAQPRAAAPAPQAAPAGGNRISATEQCGLPIEPVGGRRLTLGPTWRFSFDDFVVGPCNELAYAAMRGLCHQTLCSDQLFLSSQPGLGKTHLLQAVGRQLCDLSNLQSTHIVYLSAEEFANQWIMALKSGKTTEFKAKFREGVDVLLMEDVHFFQGKQKMQDELLSTLKALRAKGAKAVFTSSFLPREIRDVDSQLASRFCSGFQAVLDRPDFATRKRIVEAKARTFQVILPEDVTNLLADRVNSDIRQLESCLQNLVLKARLLNRAITMDMAMQVVGDFAPDEALLGLEDIVDYVCRIYGITRMQLCSKSRRREIVLARNTAFFLARKHTSLSLKDIGDTFNRRHSTVLKGISNVEREVNLETPLGRQLIRTMDMVRRPGR
ncbi:MAG: chromosomal replication initiator protein DnaA [Desulfovibrionaceae bacterium]